MKEHFSVFLKGLWVGGTMTVPGVSGGSMAMLLGIYRRLIQAVNSFWKEKQELVFLFAFGLGGIVGTSLFSRLLLGLLGAYPMATGFFFLGAVAGGIPLIFRQAGVKEFSPDVLLYPAVGLLVVILLSQMPAGLFALKENGGISGVFLQIAGGILTAAALVLPGISVSQMLLMMGMYQGVMEQVSRFQMLPLLPLGIGVILGVFLTARLMERWMNACPTQTYLIIFGFLLGSLPELFPGIPQGGELLICIVTAVSGFLAIYAMQKK